MEVEKVLNRVQENLDVQRKFAISSKLLYHYSYNDAYVITT